jgi:hypothetical protein
LTLGKRHCDAVESHGDGGLAVADNYEVPPHKRVRGGATDGALKAACSVAKACHTHETRVPNQKKNSTSEEAGCGAERLATLSAQGMYHRSLLGPSYQQGRSVTTVEGGQIPWVERVGEELLHNMASAVQQEEDHLFQIPSDFEGFRILLSATEADLARGAVDEIKCRLCPNSGYRNWREFKRHCETSEAHPLNIVFCEHCGDFFARPDSITRHRNKPPAACLEVTPEEAEEKRQETERMHRNFMERVERSLTTGKKIVTSFAQIIKKMYPKSSKKRTGGGWERHWGQA